MKKNQSWSALIIGIFVTMIIIVIAIYLLEKIIPFSRDIKGVENGNISYYRANTALNEALLAMSGSDPGFETVNSSVINWSGMSYAVTGMGRFVPQTWQWNSDYDKNWSILAPGKPLQLFLKTTREIDFDNPTLNSHIVFRVPDLNKDGINNELLAGSQPIINWVISGSGITLQSSGSQILANEILSGSYISLSSRTWLTLSGSPDNFKNFYLYTAKCGALTITNVGEPFCSLKFSLINPLLLSDNITIAPYLEYRMEFGSANSIPLQTAVIETQGYAGGFRKNITRFIQQMTTNEALDFTVFQ